MLMPMIVLVKIKQAHFWKAFRMNFKRAISSTYIKCGSNFANKIK